MHKHKEQIRMVVTESGGGMGDEHQKVPESEKAVKFKTKIYCTAQGVSKSSLQNCWEEGSNVLTTEKC